MSEEAKKEEFWRWTESNWKDPELNWEDAKIVTAGIDVGSVSSQAVIVTDGKIYAFGNMRTGSDSPESARNALNYALAVTNMPEDRKLTLSGTKNGVLAKRI